MAVFSFVEYTMDHYASPQESDSITDIPCKKHGHRGGSLSKRTTPH